MKKTLFATLLILLVVLGNANDGLAQKHETGDPYLMDRIVQQMDVEFNNIPVNIRRIAVYKINYNALRFTNEEIEYIRSEVEYAFREYAGLTILSPPELEPNDKMKIMGSDSTLQILNIRGRSLADVSPKFLTEITEKYGVQGLVELGIQRRKPEGLVLSIRMMNPESREVVWTKSFISNVIEPELKEDKGNTSVIAFGVGSRSTKGLASPDTNGVFVDSLFEKVVIDLHASYTFRQPLNSENSAYIGFTGGFHVLKSSQAEEFEMSLVKFGITYVQAITAKNEDINDYRVMLFLDGNIQVPIGKPTGEMFSVSPSLLLNLSKNLGLKFYGNLILSGDQINLENNQRATFNKISYGVQGVIRF